jgi:transposase
MSVVNCSGKMSVMKEELTLNRKEQKRLIILNQLERRELSPGRVALVLQLSERQVWRLLSAYRKEGAEGLAHGNRGRKPVNTLAEGLREKVVSLAGGKYDGFNHCHLTEKLREREETPLSRSSVRRILLEKGMRSPRKRRAPLHRSRRERCPREGMLLQTDGSPHDWLEGRGPRLCLIGAIDDATNKVPYALFCEQETTEGYMRMLREIVLREGIPMALYHDRHSIFKVSDKMSSVRQQLVGEEPKTQFGRLLDELGIESISAHSPQAKGRIERLWGTFQDRLTSEMRLAGACTIEEANSVLRDFLPEYNRRFAVIPRDSEVAYVKSEKGFKSEEYFCFKDKRIVGADNVVRFNAHRLQVLPSPERSSYAACKVEVHTRFDGSLAVYYQEKPLVTRTAPQEATLMRKTVPSEVAPMTSTRELAGVGAPSKPSPDHPWRGKFRMYLD